MENTTKYNISDDELKNFAKFLFKFSKNKTQLESQEKCKDFCSKETFTSLTYYNDEVHPYLAIVVRILISIKSHPVKFFFIFQICVFGIFGGFFNSYVLTRREMQKNAINSILLAISVFDLCVEIEYIPFNLKYNMFKSESYYDYKSALLLLFHMNFSTLFHTITISLTLTLAIFRYLAIK